MIQIQKFGGSSVATPAQLIRVARIVRESLRSGRSAVVVVSAMGKTTDDLLALATEIASDGPAIGAAESDGREVDQLLATGEIASAALLALALRRQGVPAVSLTGAQAGIRVQGKPGRATVASVDTDRIRRLVDAGTVAVVAGFQGVAGNGDVMTLGRGGSDTTAVALASALGQSVCHIYTDVDGIHTGDPRTVPAAKRLAATDLSLLTELTHAGARVVHTRAAELAAARGVDLHVASTFANGARPGGTRVLSQLEEALEIGGGVVAVAGDQNVARVTVTHDPCEPDPAAAVFQVLAAHAVPVDLVGQHSGCLTFTVARADASSVRAFLTPVVMTAKARLEIDSQVGKVSLVGRRLLVDTAHVARMLSTLRDRGIVAGSLRTSQVRISALVRAEDLAVAVNALHEEFHLDRTLGPEPHPTADAPVSAEN